MRHDELIEVLGISMRKLVAGMIMSVAIATGAAAQTTTGNDDYFRTAIKPNLDAYVTCAARHLEQRAKADPDRTFGQVEGSLRPACGGNIDRARDAMNRIGMPAAEANRLIRQWYTNLQGDIRALYERNVADVNRQRETARLEAERERQQRETDVERGKLLKEAAADHHACLKKEMVEIVPYSSESAETLGTVVMTKCADHERKRVSLAIAMLGIARSNAERILKEIGDDTRKLIVAEIVTFRAEIAKAQSQGQTGGQTPSPAKQGTGI
jgi:hypothetical protein